ncbi:MAG: Twitching motility protein PilT, partial [Cyanobacteria bacterium RYN_339]|nr:Twitching motility protein PilT [Cyanobacteria bacterium RYN_339]
MTTGTPPQAQTNPLLGILQTAYKLGAADIHIKAGLPPKAVIDGKVKVIAGYENMILDPRVIPQMLFAMLPPNYLELFKVDKEVDCAFDIPGLARFRANIFMNLGTVGAVLRIIQNDIRSTDELGLPPVLKKIALEKQGLVLVTGPTGSGKSTTLGAVINFINETIHGHLVSIEDPIELVHPHKQCIISQREVGKDTNSFARALKSALRQAPNVILIGELRDRETIELAIKGAETGHLVLSTLHTNDSVQTINRLLNAFPPSEQESMRVSIANTLRCCIAQRLVPRSDGKGRLPILDILVNTPAVRDQILKGQLDQLYELIKNGGFDGMQSTNQALITLYRMGLIEYSTCMSTAEDKQGMAMMLRSEMRNFKENAEAAIRTRKEAAAAAERAALGEEMEARVAQQAEDGAQQRPGTGQLRPPEDGAPRPGTGQLR